jgi:hypothetical protein
MGRQFLSYKCLQQSLVNRFCDLTCILLYFGVMLINHSFILVLMTQYGLVLWWISYKSHCKFMICHCGMTLAMWGRSNGNDWPLYPNITIYKQTCIVLRFPHTSGNQGLWTYCSLHTSALFQYYVFTQKWTLLGYILLVLFLMGQRVWERWYVVWGSS